MEINKLIRENIRKMQPYSSARSLNGSSDKVLLDANENPFSSLGRYPDPAQMQLRKVLSSGFGIEPENILAGNGSDELIDLLFRAFVEPERSNVIIPQPTYGMYEVLARIQNAEVRKPFLNSDFSLNAQSVLDATDGDSRIVFLCSPNNPSGNEFSAQDVEMVIKNFPGLVVLDQAYADFSSKMPWRNRISEFPNLVVLQTFSKAWGLASLRVGFMFANAEIIDVLMRIKMPYNLNAISAQIVEKQVERVFDVDVWVEKIRQQRELLSQALQKLSIVRKVFPSEANFILVRFSAASAVFNRLLERGVVVRNRSNEVLCNNCLRISVGTAQENSLLVAVLKEFELEYVERVKQEV